MADHAQAVDEIVEDFNSLARQIVHEVMRDDSEVAIIFAETDSSQELQAIRERLHRLLSRIQELLVELRARAEGIEAPGSGAELQGPVVEARDLIARLSAVWDRLEALMTLVELRQPAGGGTLSGVIGAAKARLSVLGRWIRGLLGRLWSLLSRLMTPKEWKLSGKIGSGPLGLADVAVEVTFGAAAPAAGP